VWWKYNRCYTRLCLRKSLTSFTPLPVSKTIYEQFWWRCRASTHNNIMLSRRGWGLLQFCLGARYSLTFCREVTTRAVRHALLLLLLINNCNYLLSHNNNNNNKWPSRIRIIKLRRFFITQLLVNTFYTVLAMGFFYVVREILAKLITIIIALWFEEKPVILNA